MDLQRRRGFLLCLLGSCLSLLLLSHWQLVDEIELRLWDYRARLIADPSQANQKIHIIVIDQKTLDYFSDDSLTTWPFPRYFYSTVISFLERGGAKGLAFDLLFTEHSKLGVGDDLDFAQAVARSSFPVVQAVAGEHVDKKREGQADLLHFTKVLWPVPNIKKTSHMLGFVNARPDADGVFRRYPLGAYVEKGAYVENVGEGGTFLPSLPLAFADQDPELHQKLKDYLKQQRHILIPRLPGPAGSYPTHSLVDVMLSEQSLAEGKTGTIAPGVFRDAYVFLGVWAPGLYDLRPVSLDPKYRGVEFNAAVLDNFLRDSFVRRLSNLQHLFLALPWLFLLCFGIFLSQSASVQSRRALCIFLFYPALACALAFSGYWLPLAPTLLAGFIAILSASAYLYALEGKQRAFLRRAFSQYVSPEIVKKLLADPKSLSLTAERRELSILFMDLAGFTSLSESLSPAQLGKLMNVYLSSMTEVILGHGGTLDKYIGDAVVAFWNAPLVDSDHALHAVQAALACQHRLALVNEELEPALRGRLHIRCGIHTGEVSVGNFGSLQRFQYTVLGDAANLASRLEGANKAFGTSLLVSQATFEACLGRGLRFREVASVRVMGRQEPVLLFEPLGEDPQDSALKIYEKALALFQETRIVEAEAVFAECVEDPVAAAYQKRIAYLRASKQDLSPIWNLDEK